VVPVCSVPCVRRTMLQVNYLSFFSILICSEGDLYVGWVWLAASGYSLFFWFTFELELI